MTIKMKEFHFEYTDHKITLKLLGVSVLVFVLLFIVLEQIADLIGFMPSLVLLGGVPVLTFWLNRKKIKKQGSGILANDYVEFRLGDSTRKIQYADVKKYDVLRTWDRGHEGPSTDNKEELHTRVSDDESLSVFLKIKLRDNRQFKLQASSHFCDARQFHKFAWASADAFDRFNHEYERISLHNNIAKLSAELKQLKKLE
jgi:hypothetical protein